MKKMFQLIACGSAFLLGCSFAAAQNEVTLKLHAEGVPSPALRYELTPPFTETRDEDAEPHYREANRRCEELQKKGPLAELLGRDQLDDADRKQIADLFAPVLSELQLAARCTECKWKHANRKEGFRSMLPYLSQMRVMAIGVAATVRNHARHGEFDQAISDLQVGLAMARHLENDPVLVQALVAVSIDRLMLDELELFIQQSGAPNLYWALTTMPRPMRDTHTVMQWCRSSLQFTFPALRDPTTMTRAEWQAVREGLIEFTRMNQPDAQLAPMDEQLKPAAKEALLRSGLSEQQIAAMEPWRANAIYAINEYSRLDAEIWKCWMLPGKQAVAEHAQAIDEIRALQNSGDLGLIVRLLPSIMRAKAVIEAINRRIDGLRIAEAIRAEALVPDKLTDLHLPLPTEGEWGGAVNYHLDGAAGILDMTLDWDPRAYPLTYRITLEQ